MVRGLLLLLNFARSVDFAVQELPQDIAKELAATAKAIAAPGKGILAADESTGECSTSKSCYCIHGRAKKQN